MDPQLPAADRGTDLGTGVDGLVVGDMITPGRTWYREHANLVAYVYLFLVPLAILTIAALGVYRDRNLARDGRQAHSAICSLRADLQARVESSRRFLRDHPAGFAGVPADVIRTSLNNQAQTLHALSGIHCKEAGG